MSTETNRSTLIKRVLRPPQFEDPELERAAIILYRLLLAALGILIPLFVITPLVNRDPVAPWTVYGSLLVACSVALWSVQRGSVRLPSVGIVCAVWLIALGDIATAGGIRGPGTVLFIVAVLVAGLTLGTRAAIVTAVMSILAGIAVVLGETSGLISPEPVTVWRMWAGVSGGVAAVVVFLHLARQSERERLEIGERLERILSETREGFALVSPSGQLIETNPAISEMLGYSREELSTLSADQIDAVMTPDEVQARLKNVVQKGSDRFETTCRRKDGEMVDVELYLTVMAAGSDQTAAVFMRDVTERKRAEQALRESEARYRGLFDNSRDAIFVTTMDGKFIDANPSMLNLFGYGRAELPALNAQELYRDPEDRLRFQELIARFGSMKDFSVKLQKRNGALIDCLLTANARRNQSGEIVGYEGVIRDVTEQQRTERALRESERRLVEAERLAALGSWEWDMREESVGWSAEMYRVLGERQHESHPSYNSFRQRVHPEDREAMDGHVQRAIEGGEPFEVFHRIVRPDGAERILHSRCEVIHDHSGQPVRMVGSAQDVTETKRMERALRESEEKYRVLFENAPIGIGVADSEGTLLAFNEAMLEPGGFSRADGNLANVADFYVNPDDRTRMLSAFKEHGAIRQAETRFRRKDGGWYDAALSLNPVVIEGRDAVLAIVQDISERKEVERVLRLTQFAVDHAADAVYWIKSDGSLAYVNDAACESLGCSREELSSLTISDFDKAAPRDVWPDLWATLKAAGYLKNTFLHTRKDGREFPVEVAANFVEFEGEEYSVAFARDITDRNRVEEALRASEARLSKAFGLSPDAIMISTLANGRIVEVNESFTRLSGYSADEATGKTALELGLWGDDPRVRDRWVQKLSSEGSIREAEISFFDRWGGVLVCLVAAEVLDLDGQPHLLTYATDITERKGAEEQVRRSREQLRQLAARVQSVREEERTAIAREIHDELGQALTGVKMDLSWLIARLPKNREPLLERGQALTELLDSTINTVRDLSARLRPSVLDDLGLAAAVEWQTQDLARRTGIDVHLEAEAATGDLDRDRATVLFRILQEALTNVVRHAEARRVTVTLKLEDEVAVLEVGDDGKGIGGDQLRSSQSLGILGMRERAFAFGGSVDVEPVKDGGTLVTARVPLGEHGSNG